MDKLRAARWQSVAMAERRRTFSCEPSFAGVKQPPSSPAVSHCLNRLRVLSSLGVNNAQQSYYKCRMSIQHACGVTAFWIPSSQKSIASNQEDYTAIARDEEGDEDSRTSQRLRVQSWRSPPPRPASRRRHRQRRRRRRRRQHSIGRRRLPRSRARRDLLSRVLLHAAFGHARRRRRPHPRPRRQKAARGASA